MGIETSNIPSLPTSYVRRLREQSEIGTAFEDSRLLTLTGAGGSGKTRLALRHAHDLAAQYSDGTWLVELAPLADPKNVARAFATALGIREDPVVGPLKSIISYLSDKETLIVIDNCEHLLSGVTELVEQILSECPSVRFLATSREPLRGQWESTYIVSSMSLPQTNSLDDVLKSDSGQLFVVRAQENCPSFILDNENCETVAAICDRIDGIPLAIELAAAQLRSMSVQALLLWLNEKFTVLTSEAGSLSARHRNLQSLIDWSYDLMDESEKVTLSSLSVFRGGWTISSAIEVCTVGGIESTDVPDLLNSLVERSLISCNGRHSMLETVREYAARKLRTLDLENVVCEKHANFYLQLCEESTLQHSGSSHLITVQREYDNILSALIWFCNHSNDPEISLRFVGVLWPYWSARGQLEEGRNWCERALNNSGGKASFATMAQATTGLATLAFLQADYGMAKLRAEQAIALFRKCNDEIGSALATTVLGNVFSAKGDKVTAKNLYEKCLEIRRRINDQKGIGSSLINLGTLAIDAGDYCIAQKHLEEARSIFKTVGDEETYALSMKILGTLAEHKSEYAEAMDLFCKSNKVYDRIGDRRRASDTVTHIATIHMKKGDIKAAKSLFEESYEFRKSSGDRRGQADSLCDLCVIAIWQEDYTKAHELIESCLLVRDEMGDEWGKASAMHYRGLTLLLQGEFEKAFVALQECVEFRTKLKDIRGAVYSRLWLGNCCLPLENSEAAREHFNAALKTFQELEDTVGTAQTFEAFGRLAAFSCPGCCVRLISYGNAQRAVLDSVHPPHEEKWNEEALEHARGEISEEFYKQSWDEGREMSLEEAVHYSQR